MSVSSFYKNRVFTPYVAFLNNAFTYNLFYHFKALDLEFGDIVIVRSNSRWVSAELDSVKGG